jgi:subtilisin family serine protease
MKKLIVNLAAINLIACGGAALEQEPQQPENLGVDVGELAAQADENGKIPGHYIVRLKDDVDPASIVQQHGLAANFQYRASFKGFAGAIPEARLAALKADPNVLYIEQDQAIQINAQTIPYGIGNVAATTNSTLAGNGSGAVSGPTVFIIDTGIASHADLNLVGHVNYAGGKNTDCHGHGTHVAGTVAAKDDTNYVVGVAPGVAVYGVKVLNCQGSGTNSGVIAGMDFVAASTAAGKVANMSLGGGFSQAVNDAARNMVNNNVAVAVAAGNDGADASTKSPASESSVLTVAAHDSNNVNASWSNFGSLVDLSAPGVSILSLSRSGGTTTMSGTSMASPHVAGALALYRANNPSASGTQAMSAVKSNTSGTSSKGFGRLYVGNW